MATVNVFPCVRKEGEKRDQRVEVNKKNVEYLPSFDTIDGCIRPARR